MQKNINLQKLNFMKTNGLLFKLDKTFATLYLCHLQTLELIKND